MTEGQDVVDAIKQGDKIKSITIEGDAASLLEAQADFVASCNDTLDKKYPRKS